MKSALLIAILLALAPAAAAQRPAHNSTHKPSAQNTVSREDRDAIEELHDADITGNLALDIEKLVSLWDEDIVSMPPHSRPIAGK